MMTPKIVQTKEHERGEQNHSLIFIVAMSLILKVLLFLSRWLFDPKLVFLFCV